MKTPRPTRALRTILIGFGSVHQSLARLLLEKESVLAKKYGLTFTVVGVSDSGGAVYQASGVNLEALLTHKASGRKVATLAGGSPLADSQALARKSDYDLLLEASPVNLIDGEPAMSCVRTALSRGKGVVLANKAPLVLDFTGLEALTRNNNAGLAFSATVCGGLPVINVGRRDLTVADIERVEGIFNSTSNYILTRMAAGDSYAEALAEAQRRGLAETDPSLDVDGWDTANKLVIIANAVLGAPIRLQDVAVCGIRDLSQDQIRSAWAKGNAYRLIARAERSGNAWQFTVAPRIVPRSSFLGGVDSWQMGVVFHTDIFETVFLKIDERGPMATAAAMLRDAVRLGRPCQQIEG